MCVVRCTVYSEEGDSIKGAIGRGVILRLEDGDDSGWFRIRTDGDSILVRVRDVVKIIFEED